MLDTDDPSNDPFWAAVTKNDISKARNLLESDPSLASTDFRPMEQQKEDPYENRFPLLKACQSGYQGMAVLLLDCGAGVDAKSPTEEQRGFGRPIMYAVENRHYDIANMLLDRGASVDAHGYCSPSLVDELYKAARTAGAPVEMVRKGFERYLGNTDSVTADSEASEVVRLFERVLTLGGKPSMYSIVSDGYYELVEELFRNSPEMPGSPHDHPQGSVFVNLCNAGSWNGFPKVFQLAMKCCPHLHTPQLAKTAISRAIVSHNRDGTVNDYVELIETQLKFLKERGELEATINDGTLLPHYLLAKDYLWPGWCGPESSPSSIESMIQLAEVFISYGFRDFNRSDPESGLTPLTMAKTRHNHPGLDEYADYLVQHGAH